MADFYPVLKKAVAGLPAGSTPEQRAAIYEKARAALLRQLSARDPQPSESETMRQRLQLEEVIRRLERETEREQLEALERLADTPPPPPAQARPQAPARTSSAPSRVPLYGGIAAVLLVAAGAGYWFLQPAAKPAATASAPAAKPAEATKPAVAAKPAEAPKPAVAAKPVEAPKPQAAAPAAEPASTTASTTPAAPAAATAPAVERVARNAAPEPVAQPAPPADAPAAQAAAPTAEQTAVAAPAEPVTPPASAAPLPIAVRASLYEPPAEQGQRATERRGALIWRQTKSSDAAKTPAISGTFEFPDARLTAVLLIEKNTDPALPASHNISLLFTPLPGATLGIREVLSIETREDLQKLGVRLDGVRAQPVENMVLIGLSSAKPSIEKNVPALRTQPWIYVDLVFTDGRRGALIFEKGATGVKVFDEVFKAWEG